VIAVRNRMGEKQAKQFMLNSAVPLRERLASLAVSVQQSVACCTMMVWGTSAKSRVRS